MTTWIMSKNSHREVKQQLTEKSVAAVQSLIKIAACLKKESGSEAVAEAAKRLVTKEPSIVQLLQAVEQLPQQLAKLDAHLCVIQYHLQHLPGGTAAGPS